MKKIFYIISAACAIAAAVSCEKPEPSFREPVNMDGLVTVTFTVDREDVATKANLLENLQTCWSDNDTIAVYDGVEARKFGISSIAEDGRATFTGQVAEGATSFKAVYPYSAFVAVRHDTVDFKMPAAQVLSGKQVADPAALVFYAAATNINEPLHFKNLVSLVKVTVPAGTTSVLVKANADAQGVAPKIVNNVSVITTEEGFSSFECAGSETVTLAPAEGALRAGSYYIAVAPSTASAGIRCNVVSAEGAAIITSENSAAFARNGIVSLGNVAENEKATLVKLTVGTVEEFRTFLDNASVFPSSAVLKISADLDLGGVDWTCSTERFLGSIDGQNHRIYNYVIKSGEGTANAGDAAVIGRVGAGKAAEPYYIKNIVFGSKDYDFATGQGTYDGVSKVTYESLNNGNDTYYYPGAIAYCYAYGTMENLVNFTPVEITSKCTTPHRAGALLGTVKANVTIRNCTNYGDISDNTQTCSKNPTIAGLVGAFDGANCLAEGCKNYGNVTVTAPKVLDFAGLVAYNNYVGTIKNCENHGKVYGKYEMTGSTNVGGICSRFTKGGSVLENCVNTGEILFEPTGAQDIFAAGLVGRAYGTSATNCDNSGKVSVVANNTGKKVYMGGVIANTVNQNTVLSSFTDCDNTGEVVLNGSGTCGFIAGVNGYNANNAPGLDMTNCTNTGAVTYAYNATTLNGGAAGVLMFSSGKTTITKCTNKGTITFAANVPANSYVGGISGIFGSVGTHVMDACVNEGAVVVDNSKMTDETKAMVAGGVIGTTLGSIKNCVNKGTITTGTAAKSARLCIGGITGGNNYVVPAVENCTNEGAITVGTVSTAAANCIGGIVGPLSCKVLTGCANKGNITVTGSAANLVFVGGIAGAALAKETNIAGELPATVGLDGCSVDCAIVTDSANAGHAGSVLGNVTVATEIALGATTPIAVKGSINGTALAAGALQTLGSAVTATNVTVNAVLAE